MNSLSTLDDNSIPIQGPQGTQVQLLPLFALTARDVSNWRRLARRALAPNPFVEPEFVLPLVRSGIVSSDSLLVIVEDRTTSNWIAAGVFHSLPSTPQQPLRRLAALRSPYTFLDQPLFDADTGHRAAHALLYIFAQQRQWHGMRFQGQPADSPAVSLLEGESGRAGVTPVRDHIWSRAAVRLNDVSRDRLLSRCSRSRRKSLRRCRNAADRSGGMSFRIVWPTPDDLRPVATFLRLEAMGWKGRAGTALASHPGHQRFFGEMVRDFACRRAVCFGELTLGSEIIASSCNLVGGNTLFAFKIGWNPDCARFAPGYWAEIELAHALAETEPALRLIDSCSAPGSYTESVWPDRRDMITSVFVWSRRARMLCAARQYVRRARRQEIPLAS